MSALSLPSPRTPVALRKAVVAGALATAAALLVAFIGTNVAGSLAQRRLESRWEQTLSNLHRQTPLQAGDPVARLRVPAAGVDAIVVEGGAGAVRGPVHAPESALPGTPGVSVIEAGRLGFGSFFARLDRVATGDLIAVQGLHGVTTYRVMDVRSTPRDAVDLSGSGDASILVLMAPASRLGGDRRIVVRARAVTP